MEERRLGWYLREWINGFGKLMKVFGVMMNDYGCWIME